jgi:hypothetical protein
MAYRAFPERVTCEFLVSIPIVLTWRRWGRAFVGSYAQKLAALLQLLFAVSIAQEPVIANAVESTGENVEEESPDELLGRERHDFLLIVVAVVAPIERDLPFFDIRDPMIGNRNPVRVAADVVHHLLGSGEGRLGVDDPFHVAHRIEMSAENLRIPKGLEGREKPELAGVESLLQIRQEQPAEEAGQHPYGQEETGAARNPLGASGEIPPPGTTQCRWG